MSLEKYFLKIPNDQRDYNVITVMCVSDLSASDTF